MDEEEIAKLASQASGFDFSLWAIAAGLLFSTLGVYVFRKGKKEGNIIRIGIGVALFIYPYFITSNALICWLVGIALMGLNFCVRD